MFNNSPTQAVGIEIWNTYNQVSVQVTAKDMYRESAVCMDVSRRVLYRTVVFLAIKFDKTFTLRDLISITFYNTSSWKSAKGKSGQLSPIASACEKFFFYYISLHCSGFPSWNFFFGCTIKKSCLYINTQVLLTSCYYMANVTNCGSSLWILVVRHKPDLIHCFRL